MRLPLNNRLNLFTFTLACRASPSLDHDLQSERFKFRDHRTRLLPVDCLTLLWYFPKQGGLSCVESGQSRFCF